MKKKKGNQKIMKLFIVTWGMIFIAAFLSFVLTEYKKMDRTVVTLLFIGVIIAYLANLLRMSIIILSGHYWGSEVLYWTHSNVGWLIFVFWVGVFWIIITKFE